MLFRSALKHPLLLGALAVAGVVAVALSPDMAADMTPRADNDPAEVRRLLEHVAIVGQMFRACGKARPAEATRFSIAVSQWWDRNERARLILDRLRATPEAPVLQEPWQALRQML